MTRQVQTPSVFLGLLLRGPAGRAGLLLELAQVRVLKLRAMLPRVVWRDLRALPA